MVQKVAKSDAAVNPLYYALKVTKSDAVVNSVYLGCIARRPQRTAPFSYSWGGHPCLSNKA